MCSNLSIRGEKSDGFLKSGGQTTAKYEQSFFLSLEKFHWCVSLTGIMIHFCVI